MRCATCENTTSSTNEIYTVIAEILRLEDEQQAIFGMPIFKPLRETESERAMKGLRAVWEHEAEWVARYRRTVVWTHSTGYCGTIR